MPILELDAKAFKSSISQALKLTEESGSRRLTLEIKGDRPEIVAVSDVTQCHSFLAGKVEEQGSSIYINPETLTSFKPKAKTIKISWKDNSLFTVQDGSTKYNLKLGVKANQASNPDMPESTAVIPGEVMKGIAKAVNLPCAFHKADPNKIPVQFSGRNGKLEVLAQDGFTIVKIDTNIDYSEELMTIPVYLLQAIAQDTTDIKLHPGNFQMQSWSGSQRIIASTLEDANLDLDRYFNIDNALVSFEFNPKNLQNDISPLTDLLSSKEKSGAIIVLEVTKQSSSLHLNHKELGNVDSEDIKSISDVYLEKGLAHVHVNMHPKAFLAYTKLAAELNGKAKAICSDRLVFYQIDMPWGQVKYIFPTVQV